MGIDFCRYYIDCDRVYAKKAAEALMVLRSVFQANYCSIIARRKR